MWVILIVIVVSLICVTSSSVTFALRDVSFSRLTKALSARNHEEWIEVYRAHQDDYILSSAIVRSASVLGLILTVVHFCIHNEALADRHELLYTIMFVISVAVVLVVGVAIPQAIAKHAGISVLARILPLIRIVHPLTYPALLVLKSIDVLIRRLLGVPENNGQSDAEQIEQEVLDAVHEAEFQGAVDEGEKAMIESVMKLNESTAGQIMTPRIELIAIEKTASLEELKELIRKEGHSRIPVYDANIDHILGMVYAKDLLHIDDGQPFNLLEQMRQVPFVPEAKSLRDLLQQFQTGQTHAAIVLDEYGGTAGLVTIEDILEELVGEITDEYEPPEPAPIRRVGEGVMEVDSRVHVDKINDLLNVEIPESEDYETIGGFVFSTLGEIPEVGQQLQHSNLNITILEAEDRRIKRLKIEVVRQEEQSRAS